MTRQAGPADIPRPPGLLLGKPVCTVGYECVASCMHPVRNPRLLLLEQDNAAGDFDLGSSKRQAVVPGAQATDTSPIKREVAGSSPADRHSARRP
jgi:hypothetical protein